MTFGAGQETPLGVSVVVASRGRPDDLRRCLKALAQVVWPRVEVIVVADSASCEGLKAEVGLKIVVFDDANIAAARNAGIQASGGDIIAFIDDDAVPEPMWLAAMAGAFGDGAVGAVTGPVLGRNGISVQAGAETILADATTEPTISAPTIRRARPGSAPKTMGTNMAFRASILRSAGGFDEAYRFYLDEADLNMRLGQAGVVTAYVPTAVVHHATAPSPRRRKDRAPRDITDIGRSTAAFLVRHHPLAGRAEALEVARRAQRARAIAAVVSGRLEPRDIRRLMAGFERGVKEGSTLVAPQLAAFSKPAAFSPRPTRPARHIVVAGAARTRAKARAAALEARDDGATVSLFLFSFSSLYHHVRYDDGMWVQTGGIWGRSERSGPLVRWATRRSRLERETARIAGSRGIGGQSTMLLPDGSAISTERVPFF